MLLQGQASAFSELLGSRVLLGFSQAFTNPAALCALGRIVPPQNRATVNGAYSSAVYLGGGIAALSVLIDGQIGWRGLSYLAGGVGIALALLTYTVLPPLPPAEVETSKAVAAESELVAAESGQGGEAVAVAAPAASGLGALLGDPLVRALLVASGLRFMGGFTLGVWIVPFYRSAFPGEIGTEFALLKAAVNGVAGSVSAIGGGYLADRWSRTEPRAVVWLPAMGSLLAIPLWVGTLTAPTLTLSLACLFGEYLAAECWFGPVIAALQRAAPPGTQGLTQGSQQPGCRVRAPSKSSRRACQQVGSSSLC
jgi:predicted MFS family arabinose efflux permease